MSNDASDNPEAPVGYTQRVFAAAAGAVDPETREAYADMIDALRDFLDKVAAAKPDKATISKLADDLKSWSKELAGFEVDEWQRLFARQPNVPGSGQTMVPRFTTLEATDQSLRGTATFGRYFLGGNGAAHGGAIPLLLDDVIGRLANTGGRPIARTVSLRTDYRSITPIGPELDVSAWFVSEEGRKRILHAEIRQGERLCAEAECLLITLKPGQQ